MDDSKRYAALLRPRKGVVRGLEFWGLLVYSFLVSRRGKRGYSQDVIARTLGINKNTVPRVRDRLVKLKLITVTSYRRSRRLRAVAPPDGWFHLRRDGKFQFTEVYLPSPAHPLSAVQNAVYWLRQSYARKNLRLPRSQGIATSLLIHLRTAQRALRKLKGYEPKPEHYQDKPRQVLSSAEKKQIRTLADRMEDVGYPRDRLPDLFRLIPDQEVLTKLFAEAEAENDKTKYKTSFNLCKYKVEMYVNRPVPEQPVTWEEIQAQQGRVPDDPLEGMDGDHVHDGAYKGRVNLLGSTLFYKLKKKYPAETILKVLQSLPYRPEDSTNQITLTQFEALLSEANLVNVTQG